MPKYTSKHGCIVVEPEQCADPEEARELLSYLNEERVDSQILYYSNSEETLTSGRSYKGMSQACYFIKASDTQPTGLHIIEGELGSGSFGIVYDVTKITQIPSLSTETAGYTNATKPQVLKIQLKTSEADSLAEFVINRRLPQMQAEGYFWEQATQTGYFLMNKIPGQDLLTVLINDEQPITRTLSIQNRIDITFCALLALKTQVTNLNFVHQDIKPENIMVYFGPPMQINIIDYGMAIQSGVKCLRTCGTPDYLAPEVLNGTSRISDPKTDVFSLARTLMLLWREPADHFFIIKDTSPQSLLNYRKQVTSELFLQLPHLFSDIYEDVSPDIAAGIRKLLQGMLQTDPKERLSIKEAITQFLRIPGLRILCREELTAAPPAPEMGSSTRLPTIMESGAEQGAVRSLGAVAPGPEITSAAPLKVADSTATPIKEAFEEIPLTSGSQTRGSPVTEDKTKRTPAPISLSRFRNGLAVLGALVFTGIMAPLGLGLLATVGILGGGAVLGGFLGGLLGSAIDEFQRLAQTTITSPDDQERAISEPDCNTGPRKLAGLGRSDAVVEPIPRSKTEPQSAAISSSAPNQLGLKDKDTRADGTLSDSYTAAPSTTFH